MYCRVILIHLFIVLSTLLGASLVPTGQVGGGDHNTMNVGGGGSDLALPAPLQLAPVAAPRPMQMSTQPSQMESMYQAPHMAAASLPENFASWALQNHKSYASIHMLQDFAAHQQLPMSPISSDETRV